MKILFLLLTSVFAITSILAQNLEKLGMQDTDVPVGLEVGATAPDFQLATIDGSDFQLRKALEEGPVAITFYRGYWCGHCKRALSRYTDSLSYLQEYNVQLVAISPETYVGVDKTIDKTEATFSVLSDPDGEVMRLYDVDFKVTDQYNDKIEGFAGITIDENNGTEEPELPIPATYIIFPGDDGAGQIIWRFFDPNYRKRASVQSMIEAVKQYKS